MKAMLIRIVGRTGWIWNLALTSGIALIACYYAFRISAGAGGDLFLRIKEARYFVNRVDPYLVFSGERPQIPELGPTTGYSFASYVFAAPFSLIPSSWLQALAFALVDLSCLLVGIRLVTKWLGISAVRSALAVVITLLFSPFFWQHVTTLNYNIISILGLILTFYGEQNGRLSLSVAGIALLALKPSLLLPCLVILVVRKSWRLIFITCSMASVACLLVAAWLSVAPWSLLTGLRESQVVNSRSGTDGLLVILGSELSWMVLPLGLLSSTVVGLRLRRQLLDGLSAIMISTVLSLMFFYNHVHAWIMAYPLVILSIAHSRTRQSLRLMPVSLLFAFLLVPRLAHLVPEDLRSYYYVAHNFVRFGVLGLASWFIVQEQQRTGRYLRDQPSAL